MPALSVLAWLTVGVMTLVNPSDTIPPAVSGFVVIAALAVSVTVAYVLPSFVFAARDRRTFIRRISVVLIVLVTMAWAFALFLHRDFFVYTTQIVLILFTILLFRLDELVRPAQRAQVLRAVSVGSLVVFLLWIGWLMMMSYAIVTRTEPRWIESTAYNLVNGLIGLGLLLAATTLGDRAKRTVMCRNATVYLDDRNISELLSPQEARLVRAFLSEVDHTHTCRSLLTYLRSNAVTDIVDTDDPAAAAATIDCTRCIAERWTASNCPAYRNLKNRITATKKYLELLQIGTIVPVSENLRETKEYGWVLRLFDDVRLSGER